MDPTVESAVDYYLSRGLSKDAAVALVSIFYAGESKLNTGSQGAQPTEAGGVLNPNGAFGIASWNGPRQADLQKFANKYGLDVNALTTQLHFALTEMAGFSIGSNPRGYPNSWAAVTGGGTYDQIIPVVIADYENPASKSVESGRSAAYARSIYSLVMAPAPTAAPTPSFPWLPAPQAPSESVVIADLIAILQAVAPLFGNASVISAISKIILLFLPKL